MIGYAEVVAEEEQLVLNDWSADVETIVIVGLVSDGRVKEASCVKFGIAKEFVDGAVNAICASLQLNVGNSTGSAAKFGIKV